jgi:hypothetical protein
MAEVYAWPEGALYIWSGAATASGNPVAYANNATLTTQWQWSNDPRLDGTYRNHLQGQRGNLNAALSYTIGVAAVTLAQATATVHIKLQHNGVNGSAGFIAYSGRIDSLNLNGAEGGVYGLSLAAHFNQWSAY